MALPKKSAPAGVAIAGSFENGNGNLYDRSAVHDEGGQSTSHAVFFATGVPLSAPHLARSADWPHGPRLAPAPCFPESNS